MEKKQSIISAWIYDKDDYIQMFGLDEQDLGKRILDYPAGISSFNAEMHREGHTVSSGDAIYHITPEEMRQHAEQVFHHYAKNLKSMLDELHDESDVSYAGIVGSWEKRKDIFLEDYPLGLQEKRYQAIQLPRLPFENHSYELALCSDLIFHTQPLGNHSINACVAELCRVAEEVRIFPLMNELGKVSESLGPIMLFLQQQNFGLEVKQVPFEKVKGGNAMLRVWAKECVVES
ncbi:MAG: hypothetical protein K0U29_08530 [Gammaproteobacteria bacterium]|nr:hypothetical protein [Gammaproteobacteria bacterium]MCH9744957.1 hypothetical protein [Gammaproteobacteria bacterium]